MGRSAISLLAFVVALVSCSGSSSDATSSTAAITTTSQDVPEGGRLVILDGNGDVAILDPDGSDRITITDDAGDTALYTQPIWAPDGNRLAFGQLTPDGFSLGVHDLETGETTSIATRNPPFYAYFSPSGDSLGILNNGIGGVDFSLVDISAETVEMIDSGSPFYFSWSPQDDVLVTHVGEDRVETIDSGGNRTPLEPTGPQYLAPQWTDNGVFHVVDDTVVVETSNGERTPLANVSGFSMFVANSRGTRVAIQAANREPGGIEVGLANPPTVPPNRVAVLDVTAGEVETVSEHLALGFFWSPDGDHLLTLLTQDNEVLPRVWMPDGPTRDYPAYVPPTVMLQDTFPFFAQYAQSVSFWSPGSSAFAYAGAVGDRNGVWVQSLARDTPEMVSSGRWVAWSD